ncbi:MAG: PilZ domain-containing protein [Deltaproteobacteria bacterium]|nr:PilZ domain-containing protein [Deltaproteobacteria bacterium]
MSGEDDRRGGSRIEVYGQAEIRGQGVQIMALRNLSAGGVYLEGLPHEYPALKPGYEFELCIFGSEDGSGEEEDFNVSCRARIIRVDPGLPGKRPPGFGVTIEPLDQSQREHLGNLLVRATTFRAGSSPGRAG